MNTDKQKYFLRITSKGTVYVKNGKIMPPKVVLGELRRGAVCKAKVKELRKNGKL